jgi:hypothetical protein
LRLAGENLDYVTTATNAIATYLTTEATAAKDLRQTNAQQAAGYWILATDSYADTLEALAAGSDAPWADNRAALARAAAIQDDEQYGPRPFGMPREVTHFSAIEGSLAFTSDVGC